MRLAFAWPICLLVGCRGEPLEQAAGDASVTDTDALATDTDGLATDAVVADSSTDADSCIALPADLLTDGSFERWTGPASVAWEGPITRTTDGPYHCTSAARLASTSYGDIRQDVLFPEPLAAGTELEMTAAARWVAGATGAPAFNLYFHASDGSAVGGLVTAPMAGYKGDGSWHEATARVTVPGLAARALFYIVSERPEPQTFDLDRVTLRVAPKDGG